MPMQPAHTRLLMLEFFSPGELRNERSLLFPFLKGLARENGVPVLWLSFAVDMKRRWDRTEGRTTYVDLPDEDLRTLQGHCASLEPTHVITCDVLSERTRRKLSASSQRAKYLILPLLQEFSYCNMYPSASSKSEVDRYIKLASPSPQAEDYYGKPAWFLKWLGVKGRPYGERHIIESARPDYAATMANENARKQRTPIVILGGFSCIGRPSVTENSLYKSVDLSDCYLTTGCSFCGASPPPPIHSAGTDSMSLAEIQFRQIRKTAGAGGRDKKVYDIYDLELFKKIDVFFKLVFQLRLPPSVFIFCPRIDDVLGAGRRIARLLPALARARHEIRLEIMGIENFSARQMRIYNKNITIAQVDELLALVEKWDRAYPDVFHLHECGMKRTQWSMILFSPWTTLKDVRINLKHALARGFAGNGLWLYSCLLIRRGTPIAALAKKEGGILLDRYEDKGLQYFPLLAIRYLYGALPWRFKDRKVADYYSILVRICAADEGGQSCAFFAQDPEFAVYKKIYGGSGQEGERTWTPLDVAAKLLDLIDAKRPPYAKAKLLEQAVALARKAAPPGRRGPVPSKEPAAPSPAAAPAQAGPSEPEALLFIVRDRTGGESRLHVARHREGQPYFCRAGGSMLWYSQAALSPAARLFARLLRLAMMRLPAPAAAADAPRWRAAVSALLDRVGAARRFEWAVDWVRPAQLVRDVRPPGPGRGGRAQGRLAVPARQVPTA